MQFEMKNSTQNKCIVCVSENVELISKNLLLCNLCNHVSLKNKLITDSYVLKGNRNFDLKIENIKISSRIGRIGKLQVKDKNIIEIGCAEGNFAKSFIKLNGKPKFFAAVEPSKDKHIARKYFDKIYEDIHNIKKKFDIIILFHVLEHIDDINLFAKSIRKISNENVKIIIEIPNRSGSKFAEFDYNHEHIHQFSLLSFTFFCKVNKFNIIKFLDYQFESVAYSKSMYFELELMDSSKKNMSLVSNKLKFLSKQYTLVICGLGEDFKKFIFNHCSTLSSYMIYDKSNSKVNEHLLSFKNASSFNKSTKNNTIKYFFLISSIRFQNDIINDLKILNQNNFIKKDNLLTLDNFLIDLNYDI